MSKGTVRLIALIIAGVAVFMWFSGRNKTKKPVVLPGIATSAQGEGLNEDGNAYTASFIDFSEDPVQGPANGSVQTKAAGYDMTIKFLASYDIKALVVHTHDYKSGDYSSQLAPRDLALAWGPVAEYNNRIDFHWSQSNRWYYWQVNDVKELDPVGGVKGVETHSANNHIVPANDEIRKELMKVKAGDSVEIIGYLVDIHGTKEDGSWASWTSSTSRNDTGDGACEIIYATEFVRSR